MTADGAYLNRIFRNEKFHSTRHEIHIEMMVDRFISLWVHRFDKNSKKLLVTLGTRLRYV